MTKLVDRARDRGCVAQQRRQITERQSGDTTRRDTTQHNATRRGDKTAGLHGRSPRHSARASNTRRTCRGWRSSLSRSSRRGKTETILHGSLSCGSPSRSVVRDAQSHTASHALFLSLFISLSSLLVCSRACRLPIHRLVERAFAYLASVKAPWANGLALTVSARRSPGFTSVVSRFSRGDAPPTTLGRRQVYSLRRVFRKADGNTRSACLLERESNSTMNWDARFSRLGVEKKRKKKGGGENPLLESPKNGRIF